MYHIAAIDRGENVRLSEDLLHRSAQGFSAHVKIDRPGRDAKVNPIEEVTVSRQRRRRFRAERSEPALFRQWRRGKDRSDACRRKAPRRPTANMFIALEDYKLAAGDLVSLYATAQGRAQHHQDRYLLHPGGAVRAQLFAGAGRRRRRRHGRRRCQDSRSRSARKTSSRPPGTSTRTAPRIRPSRPTTPSSWPSRQAEAGRAGQVAGRSHEGARAGRHESAVPELRQGNDRRVRRA